HGHAHRRGESRAQGARGDLDTRGVSDLWVAGRQGTPGAQRLEVIELESEPGQIELDVLGERTVAAGENETIPADPSRVGRVVGESVLVEVVGDGRQAHRGSRVSVPLLLDRIGGEKAGSVDCAVVEFSPGQGVHVFERSFVRLRACIQTLPRRMPDVGGAVTRWENERGTFRLPAGRVWSRIHSQAVRRSVV